MEHELTEATIIPQTKIVTSVISYVYKCSICGEERRYAVPIEGESVFCDGLDFRTNMCDTSSENHVLNLSLMN